MGGRPRPIVNPLVPSGILGPGGGFEASMGWVDEVLPWPKGNSINVWVKLHVTINKKGKAQEVAVLSDT